LIYLKHHYFGEHANVVILYLSKETTMQSSVVKRSVVLAGHKTSVSLEEPFWKGLKEVGRGRNSTLSDLIAGIDARRLHGNLSSAIRLFVLDHFRSQMPGSPSIGHAGNGAAPPQTTATNAA
jgi:predicted DNA-binding ribbon-helix-helix protein